MNLHYFITREPGWRVSAPQKATFAPEGQSKNLLLILRRPILPKDPGTIAAMADLFLHSNVFEHLPSQGTEFIGTSQLRERLDGLAFRLGWFYKDSDGQETAYTVGLVNADADDRNEPYHFTEKTF